MPACKRESVECYQFRSEKGKLFYFAFLGFALLVVLELVHVLFELLDLHLGRCLLLLHGTDSDLHL